MVKSQIHAGGRGKGTFKGAPAGAKGGVRVTKSIDEVKQFAGEMLGQTLVTIQTGEAGKQVNRLYIEDGAQIAAEFYLSMLVDRETGAGRLRRLDGRRHGHRDGGPRHAREDLTFSVDPGHRHHAPSRPRASPRRSASRVPRPRKPPT